MSSPGLPNSEVPASQAGSEGSRQPAGRWHSRGHRRFGVQSRRTGVVRSAGRGAPAAGSSSSGKVYAAERWLVERALQAMGRPPLAMVLWDGSEVSASDAHPVARIFLRDRRMLWQLILDADLYFGEGYTTGRIEVEGSLLELLKAFHRATSVGGRRQSILWRTIARCWRHTRANTIRGARANIHHHYDMGEEFYRLWLDREMVYSCAYFAQPEATLEEAQAAKMDYVCRKLWLRPGESVVDVGGGWGGLALYMARNHGVTVRAFNISHPQTLYARGRAKAEGLDHRVEFIEDDYRNISGRFDAFVSLGMLEHVGAGNYREFGRVIDRCLGPGGRGLMQTIGQPWPSEANPWIRRRIFPGGYVPSLREAMDLWEPWGFCVLDVEDLRQHYARTLQHWLDRFEAAAAQVARMFDPQFVRIWRLYLSGSMAAFATGALQLFQVVFARPGLGGTPWTRAGLYRDSGSAGE
jgi:cyclopropane-fatty-acyl-phospholipid synthase